MKKILLIFVAVLAYQAAIFAQAEDTEDIIFNLEMNEVYELTVLAGGTPQTIVFLDADDYNNGVTAGDGITPGISDITVEATGDWDLRIICPNFVGGTGTDEVPIGNLGFTVIDQGDHNNGDEVTHTGATVQQLAETEEDLIMYNSGSNAGDATDNAWRLTWEMGTVAVAYVDGSMFDQIANGDFPIGDYTTTATLSLYKHIP